MTCAYCGVRVSKTDDHIFAAKFFLEKDRGDLPIAPACKDCNGTKSALEHYLITVLPFGGRHAQAADNLRTGVPRRLEKNQKLNREILASMEPAWLREEGGLYRKTTVFTLDGAKLDALIKHIARGLAWHHWKIYLRPTDGVSTLFLPEDSNMIFQGLLAGMNPAQRIQVNLGNRTVEYVGLQASDPPELTIWTISMYGGLLISDDRTKGGAPSTGCSMWWAITGPPEVTDMFSRLGRLSPRRSLKS